MAYASYERQLLSLFAAGFISGDGTTNAAFGCGLTRLATGVYAVVFGADAGLVAAESYVDVAVKSNGPGVGATGSPFALVSVEDTSNTVKTIFAQGVSFGAGAVTIAPANVSLEVAVYRSVTK
jgi:hypothetical protein